MSLWNILLWSWRITQHNTAASRFLVLGFHDDFCRQDMVVIVYNRKRAISLDKLKQRTNLIHGSTQN